jgi:hypothetical protein
MSSPHAFRSAFPDAFPTVDVETSHEHPYFGDFDGLEVDVMVWMLKKGFRRAIGMDDPLPVETFPLVFSFGEVWHMDEWVVALPSWIRVEVHFRRTYPTKVIKINNLRWLFDSKGLKALLRVFPNLSSLQFIGAEHGAPDNDVRTVRLGGDGYEPSPKLSTAKVTAILQRAGVESDPFSL